MTAQRTLVIGDIHGNLEALLGALKNANFDISKDRIICIGDYVDGWNDSFEVVRTLLEIKNNSKFENVFLLGNHDQWFMNVLQNDFSRLRNEEIIASKYFNWYSQGGQSTLNSYLKYDDKFIKIHLNNFFEELKYFHIENNKLFIHAGYDHALGFEYALKSNKEDLLWNRSLYREAYSKYLMNENLLKLGRPLKPFKFDSFDEIFIGHSPTTLNRIYTPVKMGNLINVDQGCKKKGILTIWILETGKYYQYL